MALLFLTNNRADDLFGWAGMQSRNLRRRLDRRIRDWLTGMLRITVGARSLSLSLDRGASGRLSRPSWLVALSGVCHAVCFSGQAREPMQRFSSLELPCGFIKR